MNSKFQMASVSLVGAIPGLCLSIVLVIALVNYFPMTIMMTSLAGLTLLVSVGMAMLPVVIMVFGSKTVKDETEEDEKQTEDADAAAEEEEFDVDEDAADEPDNLSDDDFVEPDGDADDVFMEGDEEEFDMGLFEDEK